MKSTQVQPEIISGLFAELPNPAMIPAGYLYFATDTVQMFILKIDGVNQQTRSWVQTASGSTSLGIPAFQITYGNPNGNGTLVSDANFQRNPTTGRVTLFDSLGRSLYSMQGLATARQLVLFDENGASVMAESGLSTVRTVSIVGPLGQPVLIADTKTTSQAVLMSDSSAVPMVLVSETTAARTFEVLNPSGFDALKVDTKLASQAVTIPAVDGTPFITADAILGVGHRTTTYSDGTQPVVKIVTDPSTRGAGDNTGRGMGWYDLGGNLRKFVRTDALIPLAFLEEGQDQTGNAFYFWNYDTGFRTLSFAVPAGSVTHGIESSAASPRFFLNDGNGANMLQVTQLAATKKAVWSIPETLASFTVAGLPTPPNGGAGSIAYASNGRKTGEGAGVGTGVVVNYSSAGPAGAGWYPVGLNAALITA